MASPSRCQRLPLCDIRIRIPFFIVDAHLRLNLAIDVGADLNLVKGHSGTFLREEMVDAAFDKLVVGVNNTKLVSGLGGSGLAISVEVVQNHCDDW